MSISANDIIERAMVKARIIAPGESVPASKLTQVFNELNDMIESWALEKLMLVADTLESFTFVVGTAEYTFGSGGDFNSVRPIDIKDETFVRSGSTDYPIHKRTLDVYRERANKATSGTPEIFSYLPSYPLGKVYFWPTPSKADNVYFRSAKMLTGFTDKTTAVDLEPGFSRAIISNLAVEISTNFGKKVSNELAFLAKQSKAVIKSANSSPIKPATNPDYAQMAGIRSIGNINTGPFL